jgi:hypothetical protein
MSGLAGAALPGPTAEPISAEPAEPGGGAIVWFFLLWQPASAADTMIAINETFFIALSSLWCFERYWQAPAETWSFGPAHIGPPPPDGAAGGVWLASSLTGAP